VKLPEGFALPEGVELTIDQADAALGDLKAWAHKRGLTQADFSDVLSIYAAREARQAAALNAARGAEIAKLGTTGPSRLDAVTTWWRSMTGDDGKVLGQILRMAPTAGTVAALERLMSKFTTQGAAGPTGGRPESAGSGIAGYENMTYEQRRFAQ